MSKVNKTEVSEQIETPLLDTKDLTAESGVSAEDSSIGNTHSRRVVVSWNGSSDELKHGATVAITNGADLFKPPGVEVVGVIPVDHLQRLVIARGGGELFKPRFRDKRHPDVGAWRS